MSTLSACLIVRDEATRLEACLASLRPFVDEIVVVDTGSTDGTLEIARRLADRVGERAWDDDFSAARNAALELATGDWILSVDADEVLDPETGPALRRAAEGEALAHLVRVESPTRDRRLVAFLPRLFARRDDVRFRRTVHESVMESLVELGVTSLAASGVRLLHSGYRGEAVARKRARNLLLLRRRALEAPDDLFNTYKLAATLRGPDQAAERLSTYEIAHRLAEALAPEARATHPFLPLVYDGYGRCLVERGHLGLAARVLDRGLELFGDCAELCWRRADLARRVGDGERARELYAAAARHAGTSPLHPLDPFVRGAGPSLGLARLAAEGGDLGAAREALRGALAADPEDLAARCLAVRLAFASDDPEAALSALEQLTQAEPESADVRLLAGEVAEARGDLETALDLWRAASRQGGATAPQALARLARTELGLGRLEAAERHLADLADVDLDVAATRLVLAVALGASYRREPSLAAERLLERAVPVLRELLEARSPQAAHAFARNAPRYAAEVPGVESLLVEDVPAPTPVASPAR